MSTNCIRCGTRSRTGLDLLCDPCRDLRRPTPGPWETATGSYGAGRVPKWQCRQHHFPDAPHEGDLEDEWGIYAPLGECGPVALVAGEGNARLIVRAVNAHDDLLAALRKCVSALDGLLGDTDLPEDDRAGVLAMREATRLIDEIGGR